MDDGILPELRSATSDAHQQLEDSVQIEKRVKDLSGYRTLLEKFWGWYKPIEEQLTHLPGWPYAGYDPGQRIKLQWLEGDLHALGLSSADISALPRCEDVPTVSSLGQGFGFAYVMEGATLGGRHISGMLKDGPVPVEARHFFSSYGTSVGERWKEFIAALQEFASIEKSQRAEILAAARDSFSSLQKWLNFKAIPA